MTKTTRQDAQRHARHGRRAVALACALACALVPAAAAQARLGDLDPTFDGDGIARPSAGPAPAVAAARLTALMTRPDGRPVAVGYSQTPNSSVDVPIAIQLANSGAPDPGFGSTSAGLTRVEPLDATARILGGTLDAGGRVLMAGDIRTSVTAPFPGKLFVARLSAGGTLDTGFANELGALDGEAHAVLPVASGKLLVAGFRRAGTVDSMFVARVDDAGAIDQTFGGGDGIADLPVAGLGAHALAMALAPDGSIVLAGWARDAQNQQRPALARVDANGAPVGGFGTSGVQLLDATNPDGTAPSPELRSVAVDALGRIAATGVSGRFGMTVRRLAGGGPDATFDGDGSRFDSLAETVELNALALDGTRTLLAGRTSVGRAPSQLLVGQLDAGGALDPAVGGSPAGWRTFPSPSGGNIEALASVLAGGALYTAGVADNPNQPYISRQRPNAAPTAALSGPAQVVAGAPAAFSAGGSTDPEGEALRYSFDLDGNGSYEFDGGENPLAFRSYAAPGSYTLGVRVTDPQGASATAARSIAVGAAPTPPPQPLLGKQGVARPLRGKVRVRFPGKKKFVRLTDLTAIPNGTEIDARKGRVEITVLHDASGRLDGAVFYAGRFIFRQGRGAKPITTLRLSGGSFKHCTIKPKAGGSALAFSASVADGTGTRSRRRVRRLWGNGRGRFRTRGRYGAATVRGTKWLTLDRCDGTKVRVVRGKVSVQDLVHPRRRARIVTAGEQTFVPYKGGG